jgi:Putative transposase
VLMSAAAAALVELARDPRYVGGTVGVLAVLHTWTQQLHYHPHVHCLVTGGGVSADGEYWHPPVRDGFLVPVKALGKRIRGKMRAELARRLPNVTIPRAVWRQPWVVHCTPWGDGERGVLDYLARYVFRTAITNSRILALEGQTVTFQYKNRDTGQGRSCTVSGHEFLRRFCQHILPKGFHKVRYYGLWHPSKRDLISRVRHRLLLDRPAPVHSEPALETTDDITAEETATTPPRTCPRCGHAHLVRVARLTPVRHPRPSGNGPPPQTSPLMT